MYNQSKPPTLDLLAGGRKHVPSHIQTLRLWCIPVYSSEPPRTRRDIHILEISWAFSYKHLSLVAESPWQGYSLKPGHISRGCAGWNLPEMFRNGAAELPGMAEPCGTGQRRRGPLEVRASPALSSPCPWAWSAVAVAGEDDESIGEAPREGNREWKARVEHHDEVLGYEVLMEVALALRQSREPPAAGKYCWRQGLNRCLWVCPERTGGRSMGTPGRSRSTCPWRRSAVRAGGSAHRSQVREAVAAPGAPGPRAAGSAAVAAYPAGPGPRPPSRSDPGSRPAASRLAPAPRASGAGRRAGAVMHQNSAHSALRPPCRHRPAQRPPALPALCPRSLRPARRRQPRSRPVPATAARRVHLSGGCRPGAAGAGGEPRLRAAVRAAARGCAPIRRRVVAMAAVGEPCAVSGSGWPCRRAVGPAPPRARSRPEQPSGAGPSPAEPDRAAPGGAEPRRAGQRHGAAGAAAEGVVHPRHSAGHRCGAAGARRRRQRRWVRAGAPGLRQLPAAELPPRPVRPARGPCPPSAPLAPCCQPLLLGSPGAAPACVPVPLLGTVPVPGGASCSFGIRSDGSRAVAGSECAPVQLCQNLQSCGRGVPRLRAWVAAVRELPRSVAGGVLW